MAKGIDRFLQERVLGALEGWREGRLTVRLPDGAEARFGDDDAGPAAEVVEPGPTHTTVSNNFDSLHARCVVQEDALEIRMQGRVPTLWLDDRATGTDLSLSHHGEWVAFACRILGIEN